jgi:hypothetical protein
MTIENVYIAIIISNSLEPDLSQYELIISFFNIKYPNNRLYYDKYFTNGSNIETQNALDKFISNYPSGKRVTISNTSGILKECSDYFRNNNLDILSISTNASANYIKILPNVLTYAPFNKYDIMTLFMTYKDYNMKQIHVLYQKNTDNDIFFKDYLDITIYQSKLLKINVTVSYLKQGEINYNIYPNSLIIILAITEDLINKYITPLFLKNIPKECYFTLSAFNPNLIDIFGNIPAFTINPTPINFTLTTQEVYNIVKNNPTGYDFTSFTFYDIIFVLNNFTTNGLKITKENYISINPYGSNPPAWILNTYLSPILNGAPYGKYQYTFTKDVIINKNKNLFLKYYDGGQEQLPDSYSIFKIAGITPNNPSLIEYDESNYYKIYDSNNKLVCVRFNSDITNFPINKNINVGKTIQTKFIYKYNDEGYFIKLERLYPCNGVVPKVNKTMSKKPIKIKFV